MASVSETTAVSLRKGSHTANLAFTGVSGELVADLGNGAGTASGTDAETTLRLHNGVTPGGIPMARADMRNVTTAVLAEYRSSLGDKNLAYADLGNIEQLVDQTKITKVVNTLDAYGIINTTSLENRLLLKADKNMSNVDTSDLAEAPAGATGVHSGKNLAYYDMSNVDTVTLAEGRASTGTNRNLAYTDFANVTDAQKITAGFELTSHKYTETINYNGTYTTTQYPALSTIKTYIDSRDALLDTNKANVLMDNVDTVVLATGHNQTGGSSGTNKNLAYTDLTNLGGMSAQDKAFENGSAWRINHAEAIPSLDEESIDPKYAYTIPTVTEVRDFVSSASASLAGSALKPMAIISNGAIEVRQYCGDYKVSASTVSSFTIDTSDINMTTTYYRYGTVYIDTPEPIEGGKIYDANFDVLNKYIKSVPDPQTSPMTFTDNDNVTYTDSNNPQISVDHVGAFNLFIPSTTNASAATWPANVVWLDGGVPPPLPTGKNYLIHLTTYDAGTTWVATAEGWSTARWD